MKNTGIWVVPTEQKTCIMREGNPDGVPFPFYCISPVAKQGQAHACMQTWPCFSDDNRYEHEVTRMRHENANAC